MPGDRATRLLGDTAAADVVRASRLPLWYQVTQALRLAILTRDPAEGERLPTEAALAEHYRVSLATLRQALAVLEEEGLISRHRRRGTFINRDVRRSRRLQVTGSLDTVLTQQATNDVRVVDTRTVPTPASVAHRFPDQERVVAIQRLRHEDGAPVSYAENYLLEHLGHRIGPERLRRGSLTQVLRDHLAVPIARIEETAEAHLATPEIAGLLDVDLLSPILYCTGVTYDVDDRVVDVAFLYYRGDRFTFSVSMDVA